MRVLLTNHIEVSHISGLAAQGVAADIRPFIDTHTRFDENLLHERIREYNPQVIAITSKNALPALDFIKDLLCDFFSVCVISKKLAKEILNMGMTPFISAEANSESLTRLILEKFPEKRILHLCGNLRNDELSGGLMKKDIDAANYPVYETLFLQPQMDPNDYDIVVFSSYSAIDSFYQNYSLSSKQIAMAIGPKTTAYLRRFFDGDIRTASGTEFETLIMDLQQLNENKR